MRFWSSGLGKTELKGSVTSVAPVGEDLLVVTINTYDPVKWQLRAGVERKDVPKILKGVMQPAILLHILLTLVHLNKAPGEIEDIVDKSIRASG